MPKLPEPELVSTDVLVIGGGLAGVWASIAARDFTPNVTLVDKASPGRSGASTFASGVMLAPQPEDDLETWAREIVEAGDFLNDQEWVRVLLEQQIDRINDMREWGIPFFVDDRGNLTRTTGRGHLVTRVLLFPSFKLMEGAVREMRRRGIRVIERIMVTHLFTSDGCNPTTGRVVGGLGLNVRTGTPVVFRAGSVVLASGQMTARYGGGMCDNLTGDGVAMGYKAGAQLTGLEFCTTTNLSTWQRRFQVTGLNMIQGAGAKLVNALGEQFMHKYDPILKERAKTIYLGLGCTKEVWEGRGPLCFDMRHISDETWERLEVVIHKLTYIFEKAGIDRKKDLIEVNPTVQFPASPSMWGGLRVGTDCSTNIAGLFAAGAVTKNLVHGTYSVGGVNLAYCCVAGYRAGVSAAKWAEATGPSEIKRIQAQLTIQQLDEIAGRKKGPKVDEVWERVVALLAPSEVGLVKHAKRLSRVREELKHLREQGSAVTAETPHELAKAVELQNYLLDSDLAIAASLERTESRGDHYREEFPYTDNENWLKWLVLQGVGDNLSPRIFTEPVPFEKYQFQPLPGRIPSRVQVSCPGGY
ncbi:MAG: FAD-dependent oxidoreductase [Candidatus Binatia bacterium]